MIGLEALARRFAGVDIQHRRHTHSPSDGAWPQPWRVRLIASKNERFDYRITRYGATADEAITALIEAVERLDELSNGRSHVEIAAPVDLDLANRLLAMSKRRLARPQVTPPDDDC